MAKLSIKQRELKREALVAKFAKKYAELKAIIESVLKERTSAEWITALNEASVPCGPIYNMDQVFEDPQVKHLGIAASVAHPVLGEIRMQNQPVKLSRTPGRVAVPTPELGERTEKVLKGLGLDSKTIRALRENGII